MGLFGCVVFCCVGREFNPLGTIATPNPTSRARRTRRPARPCRPTPLPPPAPPSPPPPFSPPSTPVPPPRAAAQWGGGGGPPPPPPRSRQSGTSTGYSRKCHHNPRQVLDILGNSRRCAPGNACFAFSGAQRRNCVFSFPPALFTSQIINENKIKNKIKDKKNITIKVKRYKIKMGGNQYSAFGNKVYAIIKLFAATQIEKLNAIKNSLPSRAVFPIKSAELK